MKRLSRLRYALSIYLIGSLLGCASSAPPDAVLTGTLWTRQRQPLLADAVLYAELVDVSQPAAPPLVLARQRLPDAGAPPYALHIPYRQDSLRAGGRYEVRARVLQENRLHDRLLLEQASTAPALWQPAYRHVDVPLRPLAPQAATWEATVALQQTYWLLEKMVQPDDAQTPVSPVSPVSPPAPGAAPAHVVLQLDEALASGSGGCNRFVLRYDLQGEQLRFALLQSGLQLCLQGGTSELAFLQQLHQVRSYYQKGQRLELRDEQSRVLLYLRAQEAGLAPLPMAPPSMP